MFKFHHMLLPLIFLWAISALSDARFTKEEIERGNEYVDKLIEDMMTEHGHELDPYVMEDSSVGFSRKIVFVNVTGEAKLFDGRIKGLKTLRRVKDCALTEEGGNKLHVKAELALNDLDLQYNGSAKFMNYGPTIKVFGKVEYAEVEMDFSVDATTGKNGTLHDLTIDDLQGMKVWISGLGPINWAVNPILKGVTLIFKRIVRKLVANRVESYMRDRLPGYQFPVVGITESPETETPELTTEEVVTEPKETTTEEVITEPRETTTEEIVTDPPETTTEEVITDPPETTTEEVITDPPETTTEEVITDPPETTTEEVITDPPETTTEEVITDPPETTTEEVITDPPETTTEEVITDPPETTTEEVVTEPPETTTEEVVSEPPETTTEEVITEPVTEEVVTEVTEATEEPETEPPEEPAIDTTVTEEETELPVEITTEVEDIPEDEE